MDGTAQTNSAGEGIEPALRALEDHLAVGARAYKVAGLALRKAQDAARTGNLRDMRRLLESARQASEQCAQAIRAAEASWLFPAEEYLASEQYLADLRQASQALGLEGIRVLDGRLYCYPNIVRVEPRDVVVRVGRRRQAGVRPAHIAALLKSDQSTPRQSNLAPILEAIEQAYLYVTRGQLGDPVPLARIYEVLTLRPGSGREYTLDDFVMDVYRLDDSGPHTTRSNYHFDLPASTSTRGGKGIRFATRQGEEKLYSTIRFRAAP
jgi:hypothetical protein